MGASVPRVPIGAATSWPTGIAAASAEGFMPFGRKTRAVPVGVNVA